MKKACLATLITLFCILAQATPFLTGAYLQFDLPNGGDLDSLKTKLLEGGYNASTITIKGESLSSLSNVLQTFSSDVRTILSDHYWNPSLGKVGIRGLTYGNYLKMEAEYKYTFNDSSGVFTPDLLTTELDSTGIGDVYNYIFSHEVSCGDTTSLGDHSNLYAWVCDETSGDNAGLALSNPRFRWTVPGHRYPRSIGYDLKFRRPAINGNRLYLTVAMKFSGLSAGDEVATIKLKVLKNVSDWTEFQDYISNLQLKSPNNYYEFDLHPVNSEVGTTIYNNTYNSVPKDGDEYGDNYLFEYYIDFPDPDDPGYQNILFKDDSGTAGDYFRHINPEIYWHGNGRMELDYIVLEDYYHRQVRLEGFNSAVFRMLKTRLEQIRSLPNSSNIIYYYTKDEPFQGQFSIYNQVESILENSYGYDLSPKLITAVHPEGSRIVKPKINTDGNNTYEHYLNFLAQAKPRTIAVDAYPLVENGSTNLIQWNNCLDPLSAQKRIDSVLTKTYHSLAHAVRHNTDPSMRNTDIVYIPQVFGEFVTKSPTDPSSVIDHWKFFKPPRTMNRCLQLLPLCYSADGILDFTLLSGNYSYGSRTDPYYRRAPLMHGVNYTNLHVPIDDTAFEHLTDANRKIAIYGPILRELNWIDADCLMTYGGKDGVNISPFMLTDLRVFGPNTPPPNSVPSAPSFYDGFVQCGYYNDDQQSPSFMLVNRRAVCRIESENPVVQLPVDSYFQDAPSQTVVFVPSPGAKDHFGTHTGLFDPYEREMNREEGEDIKVSIGPGDGVLLEMCGTLPAEVTDNSFLATKAIIQGNVDIQPGVSVETKDGTTTTIMRNSVISIGEGASYTLRGEVTIEEGVLFYVSPDGNLSFNDAECSWGHNSKIFVTGGSLTIDGSSMSSSDETSKGLGIRVFEDGLVTLNDATISNANNITVNDSDLNIHNSSIHIAP